jgi:long-chain acyl-CoA synthetase
MREGTDVITRNEALAKLTAPGEPFEIVGAQGPRGPIRVFKNAPATLGEMFATSRSDKTFIVYEDERLTFEQTWRKACTLAAALVEDFGVVPGDRVAISMRNYPEWIIAFMAATSIGAVAVAMNALWQPSEMAFGLTDSGAKVLLADQERLDRIAQATAPEGLKVIAVRASRVPAGAIAYDRVMDRAEATEMPAAAFGADDLATMFYTSGSTGNPKGVACSHRAVLSALLSWELDAKAGVMIGLIPEPQPDAPQAVALLGIPLFHVTGSHSVYLSCYRAQRRLVSMYKWDAAKAAELIEREKATHFTAPSAVTGDLVAEAARSGRDLSSLVIVGGGGAARAPEQVKAISTAFGKAVPGTGWGMTETNAIGVGIGYKDYIDHPESSGRCSAVLDIRVVDEAGNALPTGERGELQVRGASLMHGYWGRPDADAASFDGDWFRTGDVALIDQEGFVYIVDRIKDLVIRGGENIGCGAVEAALQEHPAIQEACVYGVPDERLGEEVAATIYATAPVTEGELRAFLEGRLAKFQIPRYFTFESETLPRGATGKILKRQLRSEAAERLAARVAG